MSAPVTLVSGLPGNGKTLWSICMIKEWAEREKRQVYCSNIEILDKEALPWLPFDPHKWHELPVGAIIVFDEAHKVFPVRPTGARVPAHVEAIGELRHQGHNMVLITQDGMSLDVEVRRRVGRHCQVQRRFGLQACAVFEWSQFKPQASTSRKDVTARHEWVYNKAAYGWYKSAELHTVKRRLPAKLLWLPLAVIAIAVAVYTVFHIATKRMDDPMGSNAAAASASAPASGSGQGSRSDRPRPLSPAEYVQQFEARVPGLAYTAPVYDEVTKPVRAPYPAACIQAPSKGCRCYTQQGTRLEVPDGLCRSISEGGFFMAWDEGRQAPNHGEAGPTAMPVGGAGYVSASAQASPLSPGHQPRNPVRQDEPRGLAVIGANVAQPGSADGTTLAWMRQR